MNKYLYISILLIFIFVIPCNAEDNYIIDGNKVYIDDENIYLSAYPHTIYESGYVYFNLTSKNYNGNIDAAFGFNISSVKPKKAELYNSNTKTWINFSLSYTLLTYSYQNCDKWYYIKDVPIISNKNYMMRIWINTPITTNINKGKYLFAVKPSFETIQQSIDNNRLYVLDPWFNTSFTDRQKITITTNGSTIPQNYQILLNVTYNSNMQNDFDDLRFTNLTNGSLSYWIESKINSEYANIWINLSDEIIHPNSDIIYMYYGNNDINSGENGFNTFVLFDDFENDDVTDWYSVHGTPTIETVQNPAYDDYSFHTGGTGGYEYAGKDIISKNNFIIGMKLRTAENNIDHFIFTGLTYSDPLRILTLKSTGVLNYHNGVSWTAFSTPTNYNVNTWYDLEIIIQTSLNKFEVIWNGSSIGKNLWQTTYNNEVCDILIIGNGNNGDTYIDDYYIRKYIDNEPIISYGSLEYYTNFLHYNVSSNYNHTIESDGIIIVNRSLDEIDNTYWSAKSLNITYWIFTKEINNSGYTNFTIKNDNLNNFNVKLKQYSYYNLNNSSLVNTFSTNQYGIANIDINLIPDDYYIIFINQSLIPPPVKPLYPIQGILIFKDNICLNNTNKIIIYKNNSYLGKYNYSDEITFLNNTNYTIFINYDNIDIINSENFLITLFKNYGYILISIISLIILFGICIYFFNKVRR